MSYCKKRFNQGDRLSSAGTAYLSSVFQQLVDSPAAGIALVKDLDPNVALTVGTCRC